MLLALEGDAEGRTLRDIAVDFWGAERVAAEYHPDGWMRSLVKRRLRKANDILGQYRRMAVED